MKLSYKEMIFFTKDLWFKNDRIRKEFYAADPRLFNIIGYILARQKYYFDEEIRVELRSIARDWAKQDYIYGECATPQIQAKYKSKPFGSIHMYTPFCAEDLIIINNQRVVLYSDQLIKDINEVYRYNEGGEHSTIIFHDIGAGEHYHIQVKPIEGRNVFVSGKSKYAS